MASRSMCSATRCGYTTVSRRACAWSRRCWPRGIELTYETVRRWAVKFGLDIARRIRCAALARGGPAWRGARCAGAKPTQQACDQAAHAQAVKRSMGAPRVLIMHCRYHADAKQKRALRTRPFETWESVTCAPMLERLAA